MTRPTEYDIKKSSCDPGSPHSYPGRIRNMTIETPTGHAETPYKIRASDREEPSDGLAQLDVRI